MPLQNFVDRNIPAISAAWLNLVDALKFTIFADSTTKAAARTALTSDAPYEVINGGTSNRAPTYLFLGGTDTGAVNAYVVTLNTGALGSGLVAGTLVKFIPLNTNTSASTINVGGTGAKTVLGQDGAACSGGELIIGRPAWLQYDGTNWQVVGSGAAPSRVRTAGEISLALNPTNYDYPPGNLFRWLTTTQRTDYKNYNTAAANISTPVQNCMNAAFADQVDCVLPAGLAVITTTLTLPGTSALRYRFFRMIGAGCGEIFARTLSGGTILYSVTNSPILQYIQDVASTGNGVAEVCYIRFEGTSNTTNNVVNFEAFYATSEFHHCNIFQAGTGGGLFIGLSNTIEVHHCQIINKDWNAAAGLGAGRVGVGIKIVEDIDTGLTTIRKCTSRGWLTGYELGDGVHRNFSNKISECECSVVRNGIILNAAVEKCVIDSCYLEGIDGGTAVTDSGNFNVVQNNLIFPGFTVGIDASLTTTYGGVYKGNIISCGSVANAKCILLGGSGLLKACTNNQLVFGGSGGAIVGVVGLTLTGANTAFDLSGNTFNPTANWIGGAGTATISNGTTGSGVTGLFFEIDSGTGEMLPKISRGIYTVATGATLGLGNIAANVLTLPPENDHVITCAGAAAINSISVPSHPNGTGVKYITIFTTNANLTFNSTASIIMAGSANYTPGANGATITFRYQTGIAREIARTAY